jgi:hypothetical protein
LIIIESVAEELGDLPLSLRFFIFLGGIDGTGVSGYGPHEIWPFGALTPQAESRERPPTTGL